MIFSFNITLRITLRVGDIMDWLYFVLRKAVFFDQKTFITPST